jgi:glutamate formiminotransferase/glutamate formiminotransferase/formiminotetrahydrofolate cyclodeaminase
MERIVECVPNFSEGRNLETIASIVEAVESVENAFVLGTHSDADHNRSVITFVADPGSVVAAAVQAVRVAAERIDLRNHTGVHPRLGATDVLPFVPIRNVSMDDCVRLAHEAGARIARELEIPIYFYGRAALVETRVNLEDVRRGGFERLREDTPALSERAPDVAPASGSGRVHPSAGATIVGARPILIAFNVNLHTTDISIGRRIARQVRSRDGGLPFVKALGLYLGEQGMVQVSMNLLDYKVTGLREVFEAVRREAEASGVIVAGSEIVGLVPQDALDRSAGYDLQLTNFTRDLVLEQRIAARLASARAK